MDLLKELNEAQAALNGASAAAMKSADNFYQGDASKWRKFANSLMLRMAMRMSKVDPAAAEQWVKTAVANGVFESDADNCMLMHAGGLTTNDSSGAIRQDLLARGSRQLLPDRVFRGSVEKN